MCTINTSLINASLFYLFMLRNQFKIQQSPCWWCKTSFEIDCSLHVYNLCIWFPHISTETGHTWEVNPKSQNKPVIYQEIKKQRPYSWVLLSYLNGINPFYKYKLHLSFTTHPAYPQIPFCVLRKTDMSTANLHMVWIFLFLQLKIKIQWFLSKTKKKQVALWWLSL